MRIIIFLTGLWFGFGPGQGTFAASSPRHVVVVVWDGMRPDFVTEKNAPNLCGLAKDGVTFAHHHSVYPSATEVNGTAISTGVYPAHSGLIANHEYRPGIDKFKPINTEALTAVRKGDALTQGHYLRVSTVAEIVRQAGRRAVVAGAKPVALLPDRAPRDSAAQGADVFAGATLPANLLAIITNRYGEFPKDGAANPTRNDWTTQALLDPLWAEGVPDFSLLWLNQPDAAQHATMPGSQAPSSPRSRNGASCPSSPIEWPTWWRRCCACPSSRARSATSRSTAAIGTPGPIVSIARSCSASIAENLGRVLRILETKGIRESTDVLVVSDHGFSTVAIKADLAQDLRNTGIKAVREFKTEPEPGQVLVVANSGSALLYVIGHDKKITEQAVTFLQQWQHTGVIFTRENAPGTFSLKELGLDSEEAPDVLVSLRWTADKNKSGAAGTIVTDNSGAVGQGAHVSLSPFDMHNTLIAAGPDFRRGMVDETPSGNVDIAPTVLWLLGMAAAMDGRVLTEALTIPGPAVTAARPRHLEASQAMGDSVWHQYLKLNEVNSVVYCDEGNGFRK